jgi:hypothetical protein
VVKPNEINEYRNQLSEADVKLLYFATKEQRKQKFDETIQNEYMEKTLLYGYIVVADDFFEIHSEETRLDFFFFLKLFACSFSLGPLVLLIISLVDLRIDARRILEIYRRPVPYRAQDTGEI